jgi:hypothetical protein
MTSSISNEFSQSSIHKLTNNPKKRSAPLPSDDSTKKKVKIIWSDQENIIIINILKTSFSDETMLSMKHCNKWRNLTSKFNSAANTTKRERQIYKKVRNLLLQENYLPVPFKNLLANPKIAKYQNFITEATTQTSSSSDISSFTTEGSQTPSFSLASSSSKNNTSLSSDISSLTTEDSQTPQIITTSLPSESQASSSYDIPSLSTNNRQTSSFAVTPTLFLAKQAAIKDKLFYLSQAFSEGYIEGMKRYTKEKEKNGNNIPNIRLLDFNHLKTYLLDLPVQFFNLGYSCVINRLTEANFKNINFNILYPSHLTNPFNVDLSCYLQSKEDTKVRVRYEIQSSIDNGLDADTPISI